MRLQPDRRPVQEPGPAAVGRDRRARGDHPQGAVRRPVAGPDRRDRGRVQLPRARPAAVLADRQAALGRRGRRAGLRPGDGRAGRPDGRGRRVQAPGPADRQARAADRRRRLPVSAPPAGLGARARRPSAGRHAVRRRDADRQPRRRHAPRARGAAGRAADRGGGHPDLAAAARPLRDPDPDGQLPRAERAGPRARAARRTSRSGADLALVTDAGHAGRVRPGRGARRRLGGGGRHGRRGARARPRCWPRSPRRAWRVRAGRSRGSCRGPGASDGSGWRRSPPTSGGASCSRRRPGSRPRCATSRRPAATTGRAPCAASSRSSTSRSSAGRWATLAAQAADGTIPARGELVVVVGWGSGERARTEAAAAADDALVAARAEVERLTADGVPRGEAAKRVARCNGDPAPRASTAQPAGAVGCARLAGRTCQPMAAPHDRAPAAPPASRCSAPCRSSRGSRSSSTLVLSVVAIALDLVLHVEGSAVFVVSAAAILGLAWVVGLSTERLGRAHRAPGRRHPQRDVRQHRRADHRVLRPPGRADRPSSRRRSRARSSATCCSSSARRSSPAA